MSKQLYFGHRDFCHHFVIMQSGNWPISWHCLLYRTYILWSLFCSLDLIIYLYCFSISDYNGNKQVNFCRSTLDLTGSLNIRVFFLFIFSNVLNLSYQDCINQWSVSIIKTFWQKPANKLLRLDLKKNSPFKKALEKMKLSPSFVQLWGNFMHIFDTCEVILSVYWAINHIIMKLWDLVEPPFSLFYNN